MRRGDEEEEDEEEDDQGLGITEVDGGEDDGGMDGEEEELAKMHHAAEYGQAMAEGAQQPGAVNPGIDMEPTPAIFTSNGD